MTSKERSYTFHNGDSGTAFIVELIFKDIKKMSICGVSDGRICVQISPKIPESKIDLELVDFLSQFLNINADQIQIVGGKGTSDRIVSVMGVSPETIEQQVRGLLS
ncbi:MAG TPA: hypothetical protein VIO61_11310 [Anaerolineaceae bacterium]